MRNQIHRISAFPGVISRLIRGDNSILMLLAIIVGVLAGISYIIFEGLIDILAKFFTGADVNHAVAAYIKLPLYYQIALPLLGAATGGAIIRWFSKESLGAGISLIIRSVIEKRGVLPKSLTLGKMITAAITIASGVPLGPEGPVIIIASSIGSTIGQLAKVVASHIKLLLACGAAAGLAVAFNAPIAGTIFAVEVVLGSYAIGTLTPIVVSAATGSFFGMYFMPGHEPLPLKELAHQFGPAFIQTSPIRSGTEIGLYIVFGLINALLGIVLVRSALYFSDRFEPIKKRIPEYLYIPLFLLPFALAAPFLPQIFGLGKDVMLEGVHWTPYLLIGLAIVKLLFLSVAFASGASGGIFLPIIFVGYTFGLGFGKITAMLIPSLSSETGFSYASVGIGALLGAATQEPISSFLLVFEITRDYNILPALMLTTVVSVLISRSILPYSIYNYRLVQEGFQIETAREARIMAENEVGQVYVKKCVTAKPAEKLSAIIDRMQANESFECYVIDDTGTYLGAINSVIASTSEVKYQLISPIVIASDLIDTNFPKVSPHTRLEEAMKLLARHNVIEIPVVGTDGKLLGAIHEHDIIAFYEREILAKSSLLKVVHAAHGSDHEELKLAEGFAIEAMPVPEPMIGKTPVELNLRQHHGIQVLAVREKGTVSGTMQIDRPFALGDTLILAGKSEDIARFRKAFIAS